MYLTRFGLQRRPFPTTPDTSCYYPATAHEQALASLYRAFQDGEGIVLLTGAPGTGKTLLCHCLLERWHADRHIAFLTHCHGEGRKDLLQAILYDLSLPYEGTEQELRLRLTEFVLSGYRAGRPTLLIVDEAQNLTPAALEELRLLSNLEAGPGKALQVLLVGQPEVQDRLRDTKLLALNQRISVRLTVTPLDTAEAIDYLLHHLRSAGVNPTQVLTEEALEVLARAAGGVPRLLNQTAQQALHLADAAQAEGVDAEIALEVVGGTGLVDADGPADLECGPAEAGGTGADSSGQEGADGDEGTAEGLTLPLPPPAPPALTYRLFDPPRRPA